MSSIVSASKVRTNWSTFFTRAVNDRWPVAIERGSDDVGFLIGARELERLLDGYKFSPEAFFEETAVSLWLPELTLYGRGRSFEDARADLTDEVREYVAEYLADAPLYFRAPNRAGHFPWVLKAHVADALGRLDDVLFAPQASASA